MSSAQIQFLRTLSLESRRSLHYGISKMTKWVVVLHFWRISHLYYTPIAMSQSQTRVKLERVFFGYLKRVIVTPAVYPRIVEFLHFNVQSTGQKSHCVKAFSGHHNAMFLLNSWIPLVRFSSELTVNCGSFQSLLWRRIHSGLASLTSSLPEESKVANPPSPQSQSFSRSYGSILPNSLIYILLFDQRLLTLETWCGCWYDLACI